MIFFENHVLHQESKVWVSYCFLQNKRSLVTVDAKQNFFFSHKGHCIVTKVLVDAES